MLKLRIVLLFGFLLIFLGASAQRRYTKSLNQLYGKPHQPARFSNNKKMKQICPGFVPNEFPYQGIGIKIGDPFAVTYKLYVSSHLAVGIDAGLGAHGLYKERYGSLFNNFPESDTIEYFNHTVDKDTYVAARVSYYNQAPAFLKGIDYYVSFGWQFRYVNITYGYNEEIGLSETIFGTFSKQIDYMGPEFGIGVEYSYFDLPLSAFFELYGMYDIINKPEYFKIQGGVGLRYIF